MGQQQSQPEATGEGTPAEGAVAEGDETSAAGAAAADTGAPAGADGAEGEKPAEGDDKPEQTEEEKAAAAKEASEWEVKVKAAAEKYAKEQLAAANRTMAAARRAERAAKETAERVQSDLAAAKKEAEVYGGFVQQLRTEPMKALQRLGFQSFRQFAEFVAENGGDAKPMTDEERLKALVAKELEEREAPRKQAERAAAVEESKKAVFAYVDGLDSVDLVKTDIGHAKLWESIEAYHRQHGVVPDEAIPLLAEKVEEGLAAQLAKTKRFGQSQPANNGKPAPGSAAAGASNSGRTLAGKPTSGAPAPRKYPINDPDALERAINEELRAENLI